MWGLRLVLGIGLALASVSMLAEEKPVDVTTLSREDYNKYSDVASMLRCPTCSGLSVLGSDASFSLQIKRIVKRQVEQGKSDAEILSYFTERYGPWILREPPKTGFHIVAWLFPILTLVFGPIAVWFFVWRRRQHSETYGLRSRADILKEFELNLQQGRG